ncbi:prepilin-type N-terminal cleavage/methylation domain-containing protein [Candidatus Parabeggiatoa sp. HSG14]|uniref:PulJ/GspJ family protein n=1 Tax=Candidatus Parabeggiatoa sp. HSG14 TaxID=3055593 RepID=UPI0025A86E0A|nr:prepilin-type N-terminal cleavage/methylation domain-containing protein [Thiotrichales bacterium HSG14]
MKQKGFTLLEAIVALVLVATVGIALLDWVNTNLISLQRVQAAQQRNDAIRNVLAFMDTVNPLEKPQGEETIGIYKISWNATAIELPKDGVSTTGGMSIFQIGLYDTKIEVHVNDVLTARFTLRQVGFEQVLKFEDDF